MTNALSLQDFATPLAAKHRFIKVGVGGFAGSGKTRTASHLIAGAYKDMKCTKPVLMIDNENGSRFLLPLFEAQGIKVIVKDTVSLADVVAAMGYLEKGEIDFLFIDTLTKVYYQYVRDYRKANGHFRDGKWVRFMTLQDWGKILPSWQEEFSDRFVGIKGNILFTGRGGYTYEKEEDEVDEATGKTKKGQFVKSGVKMKLAGETPFEPDLNIWMEQQQEITAAGLQQWREGQILKDRSELIDGKVFKNPQYKDFKPVIDFVMGLKIGTVAGTSSNENLAPSEDRGFYKRMQDRDIEVEKIKAAFDKAGFGTSKEDKQAKVLVYEKVFQTTSGTEIEKFDAEKLSLCRQQLESLFKRLETVLPESRVEFIKGWEYEPTPDLPFDNTLKPANGAATQQPAQAQEPSTEPSTKKELDHQLVSIKSAKTGKSLDAIADKVKALVYEKRLTEGDTAQIEKAIKERWTALLPKVQAAVTA